MKKLFTLLGGCFICLSLSAQTLGTTNVTARNDSTPKTIFENAEYIATYSYKYAKDATAPQLKKEGLTFLSIGKRYNRFMDYYQNLFDSTMCAATKYNQPFVQVFSTGTALLRKQTFSELILWDKTKNENLIQRTAGLSQKYQYREKAPALKWDLLEGDTLIAGYQCKKAKTSLFGRDYIAWYAPEVKLPYGPYKFNGLPGLVFQVIDTKDNFEFTLNGLQKAKGYNPIYIWDSKKIIKSNRKAIRQIYKNYCDNPGQALISGGNVKLDPQTLASIPPKPYNPMELE